jgi:Leucine-rich repeat (LRR) protein
VCLNSEMSQSGVLPFVRGVDFTKYNFNESDRHPKLLSEMTRLRWLRVNNTEMESLPSDICALKKLEQLHVNHNKLTSLNKEITDLNCLRILNARDNKITNKNVPKNLHKLEDLSVFVSNLFKVEPQFCVSTIKFHYFQYRI